MIAQVQSSVLFWAILAPLTLLGAAAISYGLIVLMLPALKRYAVDQPNSRSSHREPTPQGGGVAVSIAALGISAGVIFGLTEVAPDDVAQLIVLIGATAFLAGIGAADRLHGLPLSVRLIFQAVAVLVVVAVLPANLRIFPALSLWIERGLVLIGLLWFINLVNFMDGIDWMTVAETVPVTLGLAIVGAIGGLSRSGIIVALALAGAMLGFAPFNRPTARLFLGDTGSLPIGLLVGWLLVLVASNGHLVAAALLPLYFVADATLTLLRRLFAGERIWEPHRRHFYQGALERGHSVWQIIRRVFAVNIGLVAVAVSTVAIPSRSVQIAGAAIGVLLVAALLMWMSGVRPSATAPRHN